MKALSLLPTVLLLQLASGIFSAKLEKLTDLARLAPLSPDLAIVDRGSFYKAVKEHSLSIVAFYDYNDLAKPDISLFREMTTAVSQLKSEGQSVFFGYYNDSTDAHMEENYFLHFHTLPKLKVFYKGEHLTYNGGHRSSHIKNWVKRMLREPNTKSLLIRDDPHLEELSKSMDFMTVFTGDLKGANYKEYIEAMKIYSTKALFAHTHDDAVVLKLLKKTNDGVKNSLTLEDLKGDEIFLIATEKLSADVGIELMDHQGLPFTKSMITRAIKEMQTFSIVELTEQMANIHTERKERFMVICDRDQGHQQSIFEVYCGKNVHAFKCYYLNSKNADTEHMWKVNMGIELDGKPQIVLLRERPEIAPVKKYLLKNFDSVEDIHTFYQKSIEGEWPPHYKTQVLPAPDFKTNQSIATSRNLMEILKHDSEEDVLLYISSQSCSHCVDMNPIWDAAAGQLTQKYPSVKIRLVKIDGVHNDVPDYGIRGFPAFLLYTKDSNYNHAEVDVPRDLPNLMNWMKEVMPAWRDADITDL